MADEGFTSPSNIIMNGHVGVVEYGGGDRGMVCMFYNKAVHNPAKSMEGGRPVYENQTFVRIHPPGERLNIVDRPARDSDKQRWPVQWAQFQQNRAQIPEGTPIDLLFPDHPAVAATMRAHNVHTIEQCADLSGNAIENVGMGSQRYVNAAKKYLEQANKGISIAQHRKDLEDRDREIATLKRLIDEQAAQIDNLRQQGSTQMLDMAALQRAIAGAMLRPIHPNAGGAPLAQNFDAATAQINATHGSAQPQARTPRRKKATIG